MILYFSGTGNTKHIATLLAEKTGERLYSVNDAMKKAEIPDLTSEDTIVALMPVYAWQSPKVVMDWLSACKLKKSQRIYFVLTCGGDSGNAKKYLKEYCERRSLTYMGTYPVAMPDNYIIMFDAPKEAESKEMISKAESMIGDIADVILSRKAFEESPAKLSDKLKSGMINPMFNKYYIGSKAFYAEDTCISCGKCVELCPLNNIKLEDNKPTWGKSCTHCMACISYCPVTAIEYGKNTKGKARYYFKQTKLRNTLWIIYPWCVLFIAPA